MTYKCTDTTAAGTTLQHLLIAFLLLLSFLPLNAQQPSSQVQQPSSQVQQSMPPPPAAGTPEYLQYLCARYEAAYENDDMDAELAALAVYQAEAARQQDYNEESYARGSRISCYFNNSEYDRMFAEMPAELDFFARHREWDRYYYLLSLKVEAYLMTCRYQTAMNEARAIYNEALKTHNRLGMGVASYCIGVTYTVTQRNNQAETALRQAIGYLQGQKDADDMNLQCHLKLTDVLIYLNKHKELLHHAAQIEKFVDPKNTTYGITTRFYTNHAYYWAYVGLGNVAAAEPYYHQAHALIGTSQSMAYACLDMQAHLLTLKNRPNEALVLVDSMMTYTEVQDSETMRNEKLRQKARLLDQLNRYADASRLKDEALALQDSIYNRDFARQIDELQTIYEVDHLRFASERHYLWMVIATGGCALLLVLLGVLYYHHRTVQRKNAAIIAHLRQQESAEAQVKAVAATRPPETLSSDELLFRQIEQLFEDKTLLTLPKLGRDELAERLATNRTYIVNAVRNCTKGECSISEYVNSQRVKHARQLLEFHPDLSIEEVSDLCGFTTRNGLYKAFRSQYDMAPADFRKAMLKEREKTT